MTPVDAAPLTQANKNLAESEKISALMKNKVFKTPLTSVVTPVRSFALSSPRPMRGKSANSQDHFGFNSEMNRPKKLRTSVAALDSDSVTLRRPNVLVSPFLLTYFLEIFNFMIDGFLIFLIEKF